MARGLRSSKAWIRKLLAAGVDPAELEGVKAGSKYGNRRERGRMFGAAARAYGSGLERDYGDDVHTLQAAGAIRDLEEQKRIELLPRIYYVTDFWFTECDGQARELAVDTKGVEGERWRVIKNLWRLVGPRWLVVVKRASRGGAMVVVEEIPPGDFELRRRDRP